MGIPRDNIPDSVLSKITPEDRRKAGLPVPMAEAFKVAEAKADVKREKELSTKVHLMATAGLEEMTNERANR